MLIEELSHDTFKQLCLSLNEGLGTDYKALMTKCFPDIYSLVEATEIKKSRSPAEKLLRDLINRQITVERLLRGVEGIGNIKARKFIIEDVTKRGKTLNLPGNYQLSPRHSTGQPQEHRDDAVFEEIYSTSHLLYPNGEQAKTCRAPIQETVFNPLH